MDLMETGHGLIHTILSRWAVGGVVPWRERQRCQRGECCCAQRRGGFWKLSREQPKRCGKFTQKKHDWTEIWYYVYIYINSRFSFTAGLFKIGGSTVLTLILSGTTIDGCESRDLPCFHHVFSDFWPYGTSIQYTESIWTMITPYKTTKLFGVYGPMIKTISGWWFQTWLLFSISYMGCHPSHWLIFFKMVKTTNQIEIWLWKFLWPSQIGFCLWNVCQEEDQRSATRRPP